MLHGWVRQRLEQVSPGSVNRDIAVIKVMFKMAFEWGYLDQHPLALFPALSVRQRARQRLEVSEFRHLVEAMPNQTLAAYVAILGAWPKSS